MPTRFSTRRRFLAAVGVGATSLAVGSIVNAAEQRKKRPNILFCISDDQSWLHTSITGSKAVSTPNFDRVAREGVLFNHAYCVAPSCTPSRGGVLTGQAIWRLGQGGQLFSTLDDKFKVYPDLLEAAGYHVGFTGKGWSPGNWRAGGWKRNPAGPAFRKRRNKPAAGGMSNIDYAANFEDFLEARPERRPFCFWYGCTEPHRGYKKGIGRKSGKKLEDVKVPGFLPDAPEVREDLLDYLCEIEWYDEHLGRMLEVLEQAGELDNTLIVVTSDNGLPFPRCKGTLYDHGVRMPMAVRWGAKVKGGRTVDDFVSLTDMAPTFLEVAGLDVPSEVTGRSLVDVLLSGETGRVDPKRDCVFTARERHTICRSGEFGYPVRAIRTHDYLYIHNYEPDRWPAGSPTEKSVHGYTYGDIDRGPTKSYMLEHQNGPGVAPLFKLGFGKRPEEELYDVKKDPDQMRNLAGDPAFAKVKQSLRERLDRHLARTDDPRAEGRSPWDKYPYYWANAGGLVPHPRHRRRKQKRNMKKRFELKPGDVLQGENAPYLVGRPISISATIAAGGADGVIVAQGGFYAGYSLYVKDGKLAMAVRDKSKATVVVAPEKLPEGRVNVSGKLARNGEMILGIEGRRVASRKRVGLKQGGRKLIANMPTDPLEVGADTITAVGDYEAPSEFDGEIKGVTVEFDD